MLELSAYKGAFCCIYIGRRISRYTKGEKITMYQQVVHYIAFREQNKKKRPNKEFHIIVIKYKHSFQNIMIPINLW